MATEKKFLAFDLGAESGRAVLGLFDGSRLRLESGLRFANGPVPVLGTLYWDALRLFQEMKDALRQCVQQHGPDIESIGCDTWGVDFALLAKGDSLLANPVHYRDRRTDGMMEEVFKRVPRETVFERTGIQFMQLNTLFQLYSMVRAGSPILDIAETMVMMPGLFDFFFTGRRAAEFTNATTTQLFDPRRKDWCRALFEDLDIPFGIVPEIVRPGTVLEYLRPEVRRETGAGEIAVVAPGSHDTASAVAAVPAAVEDYAYLSSGTWSLMGIEVRDPIITPRTLAYNFTNEGGVGDTFRFLKNIMGLWLIQESRRKWEQEGQPVSYPELTRLAEEAPPFRSFVDPDHPSFLHPGDMPARIREFCRRTAQPEPDSRGQLVRCALESLAMKYRLTFERLEEIRGRRIQLLHIVGGGSQNDLLNRFTANALGRPVVSGPVEATAIGNILMQAVARGHLASISEGRRVVAESFDTQSFEPRDTAAWDAAYERYLRVEAGNAPAS